MTAPGVTTPTTTRKRARTQTRRQRAASQNEDGTLPHALNQLRDAIHTLTHHTPHTPSRYQQLRQALYDNHKNTGRHTPAASKLPTWIDALKLCIHIDTRTHAIAPEYVTKSTPDRLHKLSHDKWRPQDVQHLTTITNEIASFSTAIDDLFAPKPIYLRGQTCPLCGQHTARIHADDGETVNRPALAVTPDGIAMCNSCHDCFSSLEHLGRLLRYQSEGLTA
jgi:hypothetical protein